MTDDNVKIPSVPTPLRDLEHGERPDRTRSEAEKPREKPSIPRPDPIIINKNCDDIKSE
jgi:hypothetical protein